MLRADQALRVCDESLDPCAHRVGLLLEIPSHGGYLTIQSAAILAHGLLDQATALAHLALHTRPRAANLALEAVAGSGAAALVALELALEGRACPVLGGETLDGRDHVVAGQQTGPDGDEDRALSDQLGVLDARLGLGLRGRRAAAPP